MKVTVWYIVNEKSATKLNHIENGWVLGAKPQPLNPEFHLQSSWGNLKWAKNFRLLVDGEIIRS